MKPTAAMWSDVAALFRVERAKRGLSQLDVAEALVERFNLDAKPTSVRSNVIAAESLVQAGRGRVPPTVTQLEIFYGCEKEVAAILSGATSQPEDLPAMSRTAKDEWHRQIEASEQSRAAKQLGHEFVESLPTAD